MRAVCFYRLRNPESRRIEAAYGWIKENDSLPACYWVSVDSNPYQFFNSLEEAQAYFEACVTFLNTSINGGGHMPKQPDTFLSFAQVAELTNLSEKTLRNGGGGTKDIPRVRLGRRVMFSRITIENWIAARRTEAERKNAQEIARLTELIAEKRRSRAVLQRTLTTILNGGRYEEGK